jgi:hypothetical protein
LASYRFTRLDELDRVALEDGMVWRPLRRALGTTGFGINAYSGAEPGAQVIERHDETTSGSARHEELYIVLTGHATFTVAEEEIDAPAGTFVFVEPTVMREAVAREAGTTVIVIGGVPGAAMPPSAFEHWYAAQPAYEAGDHARAYEIASAGLADWPDNPVLNYQLACFATLSGDEDAGLRHLRIAFAGDPRTRAWAAEDDDVAAIRDRV